MQNMAGILNGGGNIVRDHHNADALPPIQLGNKLIHFCRHLRVKAGNRFIQQQHFPGGAQGSGQQHTLLLAARKLAIAALCQRFDLHFLNIFPRQLFFLLVVKRAQAAARLTAGKHDFLHAGRKILLGSGLLGQIADLVLLQPITCFDFTGNGRLQAEDRFHQGAFAGTVFSHNAKIIACIHGEIQVLQNRFSVIANRNLIANKLKHNQFSFSSGLFAKLLDCFA